MANVLIVHAHPEKTSFSAALAESVLRQLSEQARRRAADTLLHDVAQMLTSVLAPDEITTLILDQLRRVSVARVVVGVGIGDADDRAVERVVGKSHRLDECLAQVPGEILVPIAGQPSPEPARQSGSPSFPVASGHYAGTRCRPKGLNGKGRHPAR